MKTSHLLDIGFSLVAEQMNLFIAGSQVKLCHFPIAGAEHGIHGTHDDRYLEKRPKLNPNTWLLHGHTHSKEFFNEKTKSIHVGVDAWNYEPVLFSKVEELINANK